MRPPTEEELIEEVEDGFGLNLYDQDLDLVKLDLDNRRQELFILEIALQITQDRWTLEMARLEKDIEFKKSVLEVSQVYFDDEPEMATQDQLALDAAKQRLEKEKKEFKEGEEKAKAELARKKLELAVVADVVAHRHTGHF